MEGGWGSSACATVDYEIFLSRFNTGTTLPKMKQRQTGLIRRSDSRSLSLLCIGGRLMLVSWTLSSRPDALDIRSDFGPDRYYVNFFLQILCDFNVRKPRKLKSSTAIWFRCFCRPTVQCRNVDRQSCVIFINLAVGTDHLLPPLCIYIVMGS